MNRIIKIGIDVHSKTFNLCAIEANIAGEDKILGSTQITADYHEVVKFIEGLKKKLNAVNPADTFDIECGYEAGCLGFSLRNQLAAMHIKCHILAPSTILQPNGKRVKTDARDAEWIAKQLAWGSCTFVHIPTEKDAGIKEYLRMRDDHKSDLKKNKQRINALCLRNGYVYSGTKWTARHWEWLKKLELPEFVRETLDEYMATYQLQQSSIERFDARIEELAADGEYAESVKKLGCFLGIKTHTALSVIVETSDFSRFAKGSTYAAYLGLAPGESSSGEHICRTGITKAGNCHLRRLLVESAAGICKGKIGAKSKALKARQSGNTSEVIAYADRANIRLRSKYYHMIRNGKKRNVAVTAIARELACFIWGMMTGNTSPNNDLRVAA